MWHPDGWHTKSSTGKTSRQVWPRPPPPQPISYAPSATRTLVFPVCSSLCAWLTLSLPLPGAGTYAVRFVDPWSGDDVGHTAIEATTAKAEIALPDFTIDMLVRAERR